MSHWQARTLSSTIHWAEKEARQWIKNSPYSKQTAIEQFINKMDEYSCKNKAMSIMFSIAKDVGLSILDDMIMKGEAR